MIVVQDKIVFLNYDSSIWKSILVRPEFFKKSCKKFKNKIKRCYSIGMVNFTIRTTAFPTLGVMFPVSWQIVNLER